MKTNGTNHSALVCRDMEEAVRFYCGGCLFWSAPAPAGALQPAE